MGINQKFRTLDGAAKDAGARADEALKQVRLAGIFHNALAAALGYEVVHDPVPGQPDYVRTRYRRRLPRWAAWVRRLGVWR